MTLDDFESQRFSSDATPTILGFEYQKLIALQCCLESNPDDIVYIECFGDIATANSSIETKHHTNNSNMSDQSPDFWKTLRNYVKEKEKLSLFTKLILYTTAKILSDSIFYKWNDLNGQEKYERLEKIRINPNESIRNFVEYIYNFNNNYSTEQLIEILDKFQISHSQKKINEKYSEIKNHPFLFPVEEKYRDNIIQELYGSISLKNIENSYQMEIAVSDLLNDLRFQIKRYCYDEIPFPYFSDEVRYTGNETFQFISELKEIKLDSEIQRAVIDFIRAEKSTMELLKFGANTVQKSIDVFESELNDRMRNIKNKHALDLDKLDLSTNNSIRKSKELYFDCKNIEKFRIRGVQDIQMYFQHGKMHKIVNDLKFVWKFLSEDLT